MLFDRGAIAQGFWQVRVMSYSRLTQTTRRQELTILLKRGLSYIHSTTADAISGVKYHQTFQGASILALDAMRGAVAEASQASKVTYILVSQHLDYLYYAKYGSSIFSQLHACTHTPLMHSCSSPSVWSHPPPPAEG